MEKFRRKKNDRSGTGVGRKMALKYQIKAYQKNVVKLVMLMEIF